MQKKLISVSIVFSMFFSAATLTATDFPPFPGFPHNFWGTVKNQQGIPIPDGTIIKAMVDNESYYYTIMNGMYGYNETSYPSNPPFFIEDPDNKNDGKTIYFFVGGINTTQTAMFQSGGDTYLNLIVPSNPPDENGGNPPSGDGGVPPGKAAPTAEADGPYFGTVNRSIHFDGSKSNDSDGTIIRYAWNFGDTNTSIGVATSHAYTKPGTYTVRLTVTDNDNLSDNDSAIVSITNDSDGDGWSDDEEARYKTDPLNPNDFPIDTDGDHIPNIVDNDDDNDGLTDFEEEQLGSNPANATDVTKIVYQGITFFFVDINNDGQPEIFYNKTTGLNTTLEQQDDSRTFYVDTNNDKTWEYIYNFQEGDISPYTKTQGQVTSSYILYLIVIVVVVISLFAIVLYIKKYRGRKT